MIISDFFNLILLFGAAMSFLMSVFLWFSPPIYFSNRVLSSLMFTWLFMVISFSVQSWEFFMRFPHAYGLASASAYLFFPLMYMYVKSYLYEDARKMASYWWHFIPSLVFVIIISPFYFQSGEVKVELLQKGVPEWLLTIFYYGDIVVVIQGVVYSIFSIKVLQHFQYFRSKRLTKEQNYSVKWIMQFVLINIVLWAIATIGAMMQMLNIKVPIDPFKIYYLGITLLTLRLGYFSIKYPYSFSRESSKQIGLFTEKEKKKNYSSSNVDKNDLKTITHFLKNEKPYLKNDLNLQDLVIGTGLTKHRISELFNRELDQSFYEVINEYRINEVLRLIEGGKYKEFTLAHIAEKAGFNSNATFYRVFKKVTGSTPTDYIKSKEE